MKKLIVSTLVAFALNAIAAGAYAQQWGPKEPQGCDPHPHSEPCMMWNYTQQHPEEVVYYNAYAYDLQNQQAQGATLTNFDHGRAADHASYAMQDWQAGGGHYQSEQWMTQPQPGTPYMGSQPDRGPWQEGGR